MTLRIRLRAFVDGWMRITGSRECNGETGVVRQGRFFSIHPLVVREEPSLPDHKQNRIQRRLHRGLRHRANGGFAYSPLKFFAPKSGLNAISIKACGEILAPKRVYLGDESAKKR